MLFFMVMVSLLGVTHRDPQKATNMFGGVDKQIVEIVS